MKLKGLLNKLYKKFNDSKYIFNDPIEFPHRYKEEEDIVLAGFISAIFSFGRVSLFKQVLEKIFDLLNPDPSSSLRILTNDDIYFITRDIEYRFYKNTDIALLLIALKNILKRGSLIDFFSKPFIGKDVISGAKAVRLHLLDEIKEIKPWYLSNGINFMFPDLSKGGASKRFFMFLRWMVRKDNIDFGIIKTIKKSELIVPLDTHIANIGRLLGMTHRQSNDLRCAIEITNFLRDIDPCDPVRYDFALAHTGITEGCRHRYIESICKNCIFAQICNNKY